MPDMPPSLRSSNTRTKAQRDQDHDAKRAESATRKLYGSRLWRNLRALQLAEEPNCRLCAAEGDIEPATLADHIEPHGGDPARFYSGDLQSLCRWHFDRIKWRGQARTQRGGGLKSR
jgi:hypothetical protein